MKKKLLSLLLSAALLISAGCVSGQNSETTASAADTTTTTAATVVSEQPAGGTESPEASDPAQNEFIGYDPEITVSGEETEPPQTDAPGEKIPRRRRGNFMTDR